MAEAIQSDDQHQSYDILNGNFFKIDDKFIFKFIDKNDDARRDYKVIKITCGWSEVLTAAENLKPEEYPNVFIIVIEAKDACSKTKNREESEKLLNILTKNFGKNRPLVLQLTKSDENFTNFYYKGKYSNDFLKIDQNEKNFEKFLNFPTFFCSLMSGARTNFEDIVIKNLPQIENITLILRFMDALSDINGGFSFKVKTYLEKIVKDLSAYEKIQKLPLEHKINLSTAAFELNQLDILCDLVEFLNLPFPKNFDPMSYTNEHLTAIVNERIELQNAIHSDDKQRIKYVCKNNPKLKKAYLLNNKTALYEAFHSKKKHAFIELKSSNFETAEGENAKMKSLDIEVRLIQQANEENKDNAISHSESSLLAIKNKSKIHNKDIDEETRKECELAIEEWYKDIDESKYGELLLDVVTLCEKLKIFFDFESESTESMKLDDQSGIAGHTYHKDNTIYIGARIMSNGINRKQTVRGHVAHELCHYAMHLVYENSMLPFYEKSGYADDFKQIEREYFQKYSKSDDMDIDDGCGGIISSIYSLYAKNSNPKEEEKSLIIFQLELIVRVIQIFTYYKDDEVTLKYLEEERHKPLFDYFKNRVVPEMKAFLKSFTKRSDVRNLNEKSGQLQCIKSMKYEFSDPKSVDVIDTGDKIIVSTNQPRLFLLNTYKTWDTRGSNLFDTANIVIKADLVDDEDGFNEYKKVLNKHSNLTIFIDCTKGLAKGKMKILQNKENHRFIFIVLKEDVSYEMCLKYKVSNFNFKLGELTEEGQVLMDQIAVNFGGIVNCSIRDLLSKNFNQMESTISKSNQEAVAEILEDVPEIRSKDNNDELLNWLLKSSDVSINPKGSPPEMAFRTAINQENCLVISDLAEKGKTWMIKKIVNPQPEQKLTRWATFVDTDQISRKLENKLEFSSFMMNKILKNGGKFGADIFKNFHKNGKVLFLVDGFGESAPNNATFLAKMNYSWSDLIENSQILLIKNNIMFENYNSSFYMLLRESINPEGKAMNKKDKEILDDFSEIVDNRLLNLLMEPNVIKINTKLEGEKMEKNYDYLFQTRQLIYNKNKTNHKIIPYEEFIDSIINEKYILISDMAGSGKSWMMKTFASLLRKKYPKRWVTYVDLKQYIKVFKKKGSNLDFLTFMTEKILEPTNKFEMKMFTKFYKAGKIFVLFDGFDEIAPEYAQVVADLSKSFKSIGKNQLWIATRDYIEPNLQRELKISAVYQLNDFKEQDGIRLIASKWVLNDFKERKVQIFTKDSIEIHENYSKYQNTAEHLIKRISKSSFRQVGIPLLFSVLADGFNADDDSTEELTVYDAFENASDKYIEEWYSRGEIRKKKHLKSLDKDMNFNRLHEFLAIKSYNPEKSRFCGLSNDYYYFLYETFREFYAAKFIIIIFKNSAIPHPEVFQYFLVFLTDSKFRVVRSFLNAALSKRNFLNDQNKIQKVADSISETVDLSCIFAENHEYLVDVIISALGKMDYDKMHSLVFKNYPNIINKSESSATYAKFQEFFLNSLKPDDLKIFVENNGVFHSVIKVNKDFEIFENLVTSVEKKAGKNFVKETLEINYTAIGGSTKNIFHFLIVFFKDLNDSKVRNFFDVLKKYLKYAEIIQLMKNCNKPVYDLLEFAIALPGQKFRAVWNGIKYFFDSFNRSDDFKDFVLNREKCIIKRLSEVLDVGLHNAFWDLFSETFTNPEDVKNIILKASIDEYKLCQIFVFSKSFFLSYFSPVQLQAILKIKDKNGANVLQNAASYAFEIDIFNSFLDVVKNSFGTKFYEIIKEEDTNGNNIIYYAAKHRELDTFRSIMNELTLDEKITHKEIRDLFAHLNKKNCLFLSQILFNISSENIKIFFNILWKYFQIYFTQSEILEFLQHCNPNGKNCFSYISEKNKKVVVEILRETLLSLIPFDVKNGNESYEEILKLKWAKTESMRAFDLTAEEFQDVIRSRNLFENASDLKALAYCNNLEIHKISWNYLSENLENLKKLLTQNSISGNNFIQNLLMHNKSNEIIKYTIDQIKEKFPKNQVQEILESKNCKGENSIVFAAQFPQHIDIYRALLQAFQNNLEDESNLLLHAAGSNTDTFMLIWSTLSSGKTPNELKNLILQKNNQNEYILQVAIQSKDKKLVETIWQLQENFFKSQDFLLMFIGLLMQQTIEGMNILHLTAKNDDIEFHRALWDLLLNTFRNKMNHNQFFRYMVFEIHSYLDYLKILILQKDSNDENFINCIIKYNTSEIVKFVIEEKFQCFNKKEIREIITAGGDCDLLHSALRSKDVEKYKILWKIYQNYFSNLTQKFKLFSATDKDGKNLLVAAAESNAELFKNVWEIVEELVKNRDISKASQLIETCDKNGKTILQICIESSDIELLKIVLEKLKYFYLQVRKSPDALNNLILKRFESSRGKICTLLSRFREGDYHFHEMVLNLIIEHVVTFEETKNLIMEVNDNNSYIQTIFSNLDSFANRILEFLRNKLTNSQLRQILCHKDVQNMKLIGYANAVIDVEGMKKLLEIMKEIYTNEEFYESLQNVDGEYNNLLFAALKYVFRWGSNSYTENVLHEIFTLVIKVINELPKEQTQKILRSLNYKNQNVLEFMCGSIKFIEMHKVMWDNVTMLLDRSEMLNIIQPINRDTILFTAVTSNSVEIADFTWDKIKENLDTSYFQYLENSFRNCNFSEKVKKEENIKWVTDLLEEYKIQL